MHLAHFAWTDAARGSFRYEEKTHLDASRNRVRRRRGAWPSRTRTGPREESGGTHRLHAAGRGWDLSLALKAVKPPVVHGGGGLSRKGPGDNEYSRYVSITRLAAAGTMRNGADEVRSLGNGLVRPRVGTGRAAGGRGGMGLVRAAARRRLGPDALPDARRGRKRDAVLVGHVRSGGRRAADDRLAGRRRSRRRPSGSLPVRARATRPSGGSPSPRSAWTWPSSPCSRTRSSSPNSPRASPTGRAPAACGAPGGDGPSPAAPTPS